MPVNRQLNHNQPHTPHYWKNVRVPQTGIKHKYTGNMTSAYVLSTPTFSCVDIWEGIKSGKPGNQRVQIKRLSLGPSKPEIV